MKSIILVVLFLLVVQQAFAQGTFLERGQSGIGALVGYSGNKFISTVDGAVEYSFSGMFDLQYGLSSVTNDFQNQGMKGKLAQGLDIVVCLFKQDDNKTPLSFSAGFGYSWMKVNKKTEDDIAISGSISRNSMIDETNGINTTFGISHTFDPNTGVTMYGFSIAYFNHISNSLIFEAGPSVGFTNSATTIGISAGIIFITNN